ncbi:MAG: hypothetical protein KGH55_00075 [Nanoarchaeota archaeon]|nr:hypothetical protein [Nanoarchaeota archaeon]
MNKRGFLLGEETVKIILAVIALIFLVAFIVYLYMNYSQDKDLQYAQSSLNYLVNEINSGSTQAEIYNPSGWYISSFPTTPSGIGAGAGITQIPNECSSVGWAACICIYKSESNLKIQGSSESFDLYGQCQQSDFAVKGSVQVYQQYAAAQSNTIQINPPLSLSIDQQTKTIQNAG